MIVWVLGAVRRLFVVDFDRSEVWCGEVNRVRDFAGVSGHRLERTTERNILSSGLASRNKSITLQQKKRIHTQTRHNLGTKIPYFVTLIRGTVPKGSTAFA